MKRGHQSPFVMSYERHNTESHCSSGTKETKVSNWEFPPFNPELGRFYVEEHHVTSQLHSSLFPQCLCYPVRWLVTKFRVFFPQDT